MSSDNNILESLKNFVEEELRKTIEERTLEKLQHIKLLDNYDFTPFLSEGLSVQVLINNIEEVYDKDFKNKYGFYMFDTFDLETIMLYFKNRYKIDFQPYTDWVVRRKDGINK